MAPRAAAKKLTSEEYFRKLSSPKVEIYVSKKRKQFPVPKDLLIYYSGYFESQLNPSIKREEADTDHFHFPDDNADDFSLIIDYIYRGAVISALPDKTDALKVAHCINFIKLTGELEIGEAASVVYPVLNKVLARRAQCGDRTALVTAELICIAFETIPARNNILELLARAAMPETLQTGGGKYAKVLEECDAFAAESWRQFQAVREKLTLSFPFNVYPIKTFIDKN